MSLAALPASSEDEDSWRDFFDTHVYAREVRDTECDSSSEHMSTPAANGAASVAVTAGDMQAELDKPHLDGSTAAEHTIDSEQEAGDEELESIMCNLWG